MIWTKFKFEQILFVYEVYNSDILQVVTFKIIYIMRVSVFSSLIYVYCSMYNIQIRKWKYFVWQKRLVHGHIISKFLSNSNKWIKNEDDSNSYFWLFSIRTIISHLPVPPLLFILYRYFKSNNINITFFITNNQ